MGFKCAPQVMGLVRGEPKAGQKHRGNGMAFCKEAGIERASRSETLHRDRRDLDIFIGPASGEQLWNDFCDEADRYRIKGKTKNGKDYERGLGKNAVIASAIIFNPPEDATLDWTPEKFQKFHEDSLDAMAEFDPDLFRRDNRRASDEHGDEGRRPPTPTWHSRHWHDFYITKDRDGHYCGNRIDGKLLGELNKFYPKFMRSRGWEMDDLDVTDWDRYKTDSEYHASRKSKSKNHGKSVNEHIADEKMKELDKKKAELAEQQDQLAQMADSLSQQMHMMSEQSSKLDDRSDSYIEWTNELDAFDDELKKKQKKLSRQLKVVVMQDALSELDRYNEGIQAEADYEEMVDYLSLWYDTQMDYERVEMQRQLDEKMQSATPQFFKEWLIQTYALPKDAAKKGNMRAVDADKLFNQYYHHQMKISRPKTGAGIRKDLPQSFLDATEKAGTEKDGLDSQYGE